MDGFRLFLATSGPSKRRKHYFCLLFSQYCVCYFLNIASNPKRNFLSKKEFWEYHGWNRIENPISKHYTNFQNLKKTQKKPTNSFSNLDFLPKSGFPKILDLFMDFQGFPTPWISHPMGFGFSGRPRERPTKTKIGRQGRQKPVVGGAVGLFWVFPRKRLSGYNS